LPDFFRHRARRANLWYIPSVAQRRAYIDRDRLQRFGLVGAGQRLVINVRTDTKERAPCKARGVVAASRRSDRQLELATADYVEAADIFFQQHSVNSSILCKANQSNGQDTSQP